MLARHLRRWGLEPEGEPWETASSWLQRVRCDGEPAVLKAPKPGSDEHLGAAMLRYYDGDGAVRVLRAEEGGACVLERADGGRSLAARAAGGDDEGAAEALAGVVTRLLAPRASPAPEGLEALEARFRPLVTGTAAGLLGRCAAVARGLLAAPRGRVPLHGDLHHDNVLDGGPRGWLAIDPKGVVGEAAYEVANLLCNPVEHPGLVLDPSRMERLAALYGARLGLDPPRLLAFGLAHAGLSACWSEMDGEDPTHALRCAECLAGLVRVNAVE
ncbi:MAG: 3'-kinase [Deltaproteobacteria bacterium]|nr:3'-kinase [Deltaproteobacteria bacterium]